MLTDIPCLYTLKYIKIDNFTILLILLYFSSNACIMHKRLCFKNITIISNSNFLIVVYKYMHLNNFLN